MEARLLPCLVLVTSLFAVQSFVPAVPLKHRLSVALLPPLAYKHDEAIASANSMVEPIALDERTASIDTTDSVAAAPISPPSVERRIVLPFASQQEEREPWWHKVQQKWTVMQKKLKRPGVEFRMRLGFVAMTALSMTSILVPRARMANVIKSWLSHRGFQGISALGRSIAYVWALFVGYPRLLDRRAADGKKRDRDRVLDGRRKQLSNLSSEAMRLRQELGTIDAEIRTFRREIISLKAYAKDDNPEVHEAIGIEMAHLAQLRSDTYASLASIRQALIEHRSNMGAMETGEESDLLF